MGAVDAYEQAMARIKKAKSKLGNASLVKFEFIERAVDALEMISMCLVTISDAVEEHQARTAAARKAAMN